MTAIIIPFRRATASKTKSGSFPFEWTAEDHRAYESYIQDGLSAEHAKETINESRAICRMSKLSGETEEDLLLRQARAAFQSMNRKKQRRQS